jgi:hypothetical protein
MGNLQDGHLPRAVSATLESLDSTDLTRCLEGTREAILRQVYQWMDGDNPQIQERKRLGMVNAKETPRIFWINGSAGTGMTVYLLVGTRSTLITEQARRRSRTPSLQPAERIKLLGGRFSAHATVRNEATPI